MQDRLKNRMLKNSQQHLPTIPDKLYFTIGEVARLCEVKPHVLRYWEQEFPQLSPVKRKGNRRYYQRKDVILICQIKELLYGYGFTIEGARAQIVQGQMQGQGQGKDQEKECESPKIEAVPSKALQRIINDLEMLVEELEG